MMHERALHCIPPKQSVPGSGKCGSDGTGTKAFEREGRTQHGQSEKREGKLFSKLFPPFSIHIFQR